jgi:hypothetical protein
MSDEVKVDSTELDKLAADLGRVPDGAGKKIRQAVEVGARNVKDGWRQKISGSRGVSHGAASISYDIKGGASTTGSEVSAEIGPVLNGPGGQGPIVGLIEMGTPTLSPRGYGLAALQEEQADFEKGLEIAIDQALDGLGL